MALPQFFAAAGEIPEPLRDHYTEKDGRFVLQMDPPAEDVTGLKSALDSERKLRREAEGQLTTMKTRYDGIDPDDVARMRERIEGLKDKELYDKDGLEALVGRRTQQMKEDFARQYAQKERELTTLKDQHAELNTRWKRDRIETDLTADFLRAGIKESMPFAIDRALTVFRDLDDHGKPVAKKGEEVVYGKNGVDPLTPYEWILSLRSDFPFLWPSSSGGGASQGHTNGVPGGMDFSKLPPAERLTKYREAQAAGKK